MSRLVLDASAAPVLSSSDGAQVQPFPADFRTQEVDTNGTVLHVRIGGHGPAALLLHGYGETGDMWAAAADVSEVVIPNAGHWLMEEQPAATIAAVRAFLDRKH